MRTYPQSGIQYDASGLLEKRHLPGKHNQKDHGRPKGGGSAVDAKAIEQDLASGKTLTVHPDDVDALMAEFSDGPVFNLKKMQVSGSENKNCYRRNLRDIPRSEMPQLPQSVEEIGAFKAKLAEHGISANLEEVDPRSLVATQSELNAQKVAKIYSSIRKTGWNDDNIMFISQEGAVLDGHHRWAGASAAAMAGTRVRMKTVRVNTDIDTLLAIANTVSLPKKTLSRSRVSFDEEPTTPPPSENEPWIWLDGQWFLVVTDTGDGVPESLDDLT